MTPNAHQPEPLTKQAGGSISHFLLPFLFVFLHVLTLTAGVLLAAGQQLQSPLSALNGLDPGQLSDELTELLAQADVNNLGALYMACFMVPVCLIFLYYRRQKYPRVIQLAKPQPQQITESLIWVLAGQSIALLWMFFLSWAATFSGFLAERVAHYEELMNLIAGDEQNTLLMVLSTSLVIPLVEECIYRGVVFGELRQVLTDRRALLLQALVFGFIHGNLVQGVYAFILAYIIGMIYLKSNSFLLCFMAHAVFNFLGGALPFLLGEESVLLIVLRLLELVALGYVVNRWLRARREPVDRKSQGS